MKKCESHGDVYLDCEGKAHTRRDGQRLCAAHWAVHIYQLITGK
jgi:hypothetical protein